MRQRVKNFIERVSLKEMREVLNENLTDIEEDKIKKTIILHISKRYAMNLLRKSKNIGSLLKGVMKGYGEDYHTTMKLDKEDITDKRHLGLPYILHY